MGKKIIINESILRKIIEREIVNENNFSKSDITSIVRDTIKGDAQVKKDIEKRVKELVAASVNTLFKTLWQRRNFYEDEIKK
jgi:hypothetical protein